MRPARRSVSERDHEEQSCSLHRGRRRRACCSACRSGTPLCENRMPIPSLSAENDPPSRARPTRAHAVPPPTVLQAELKVAALDAIGTGSYLEAPPGVHRDELVDVRRAHSRYDRSRVRAAPGAAEARIRGPRAALGAPPPHRRHHLHRQARAQALAWLTTPPRAAGDVVAARRRRDRTLLGGR